METSCKSRSAAALSLHLVNSSKKQDSIADDPKTHGSMFVPVILGSDKTTVSVGTGHNEYYPLYMSIGNIHNNVRRAHRNGVVILGFLAILKSMFFCVFCAPFVRYILTYLIAKKQYTDDLRFRNFRRQMFHASLSKILQPLKPGMTTPEVVRCPDGHFRQAIYGLGPYIADYPEQALLACVVQGWCPKCVVLSQIL
jgi:hypothetical protein